MILIFLWAFGGVMLMAGFAAQPRSQAPICFAVSFICLLIAALWSKSKYDKSKAVSNAAKNVKYDLKTSTLTVLSRVPENEVILKIDDVRHLNFKYNPAELVYTGATTGSVSMGGFHINEASMSASQGGKTGKFRIVYTGPESKENYCQIKKIRLSDEMVESAKSNYTVSRFLKDDTLILEHETYSHSSAADRQASLDAYNSGRMDIFYGLNVKQYVDMQLTLEECQAILSWLLGTDLNGSNSLPDNNTYKKQKALNHTNSILMLTVVSGAFGLIMAVINSVQNGYFPILSYLVSILVIAEGILLHKAIKQGSDNTANQQLTISLVLSALLSLYFAYQSLNMIMALAMGAIPLNALYCVCSLIASVMVFVAAVKLKKKTD